MLNELKANDKIEVQIEEQLKKQVKFIGSQRKVPGLTMWEYNTITKEISKAVFAKNDVTIVSLKKNEVPTLKRRININEGCIYFQALNYVNAEKRLKKIYNKNL